jgi:curli biogenesis system outer membrane secretion channel CsgG
MIRGSLNFDALHHADRMKSSAYHFSIYALVTSLAMIGLIGCGGVSKPALKFPKLEEPTLPNYTGPRFRVALAPFKTLEAAKELLDNLGYTGIEVSLTEQATNKLVNAGYLQVLERSMLNKVVDNLNLEADSELFNQATTQKKGGFVGAEYTLVGAIEEVEPNLSKSEMEASIPMVANLKGSLEQTSVRLAIRLVHSGTGEVLAAGTGHGVMKTGGIGLQANTLNLPAGKGASLSISQSGKTPLGFVFNVALHQALTELSANLVKAPWSCRVAGAKETRVIIECGAKHRVKKGMVFQYYSRNGSIKNEAGEVIGFDEEENGTAVVKSVQPKASVATHTGETPPKIGDAVVLIQADQE